MQRRILSILVGIALVGVLTATGAWAGSPHFTECSVTRTDDSLVASGVENGLGNETQVNIQVTATASCINSGSNHPKAANKESVSAEGTFPVQNGRAEFDLTLTATFQPSCSPPMEVVFTNVQVCDIEHNVCCTISGTF
jgi:hypothetical protein